MLLVRRPIPAPVRARPRSWKVVADSASSHDRPGSTHAMRDYDTDLCLGKRNVPRHGRLETVNTECNPYVTWSEKPVPGGRLSPRDAFREAHSGGDVQSCRTFERTWVVGGLRGGCRMRSVCGFRDVGKMRCAPPPCHVCTKIVRREWWRRRETDGLREAVGRAGRRRVRPWPSPLCPPLVLIQLLIFHEGYHHGRNSSWR